MVNATRMFKSGLSTYVGAQRVIGILIAARVASSVITFVLDRLSCANRSVKLFRLFSIGWLTLSSASSGPRSLAASWVLILRLSSAAEGGARGLGFLYITGLSCTNG